MAKIYMVQRTLRDVAKRLGTTYLYEASFGTFGTPQTNTTGLNSHGVLLQMEHSCMFVMAIIIES